MRLATQQDFEGLSSTSLYTSYRKYPFFAQRATWLLSLHARLNSAGIFNKTVQTTKVLIAGCAYGYLVEELVARGFDAYGFDASPYANQKAATSVNATTRQRVMQRDMTIAADYTEIKRVANVRGQSKFDILVTEDVLPCLTDTEIQNAIPQARNAATVLVHIITPGTLNDPSLVVGLNWKTMNEWYTFLTTNSVMPDWLLSAEGNPNESRALEYLPTQWIEPI